MKSAAFDPAALPGLSLLPAPLAKLVAAGLDSARKVVEKLPVEPPSFVLAQVLNRLLLPRLDDNARAALAQRAVEICVSDLGLRCRLLLGERGFVVARRAEPVALRVIAPADAFRRLAEGREDPDTLFFERVLVMEGDTEYGLLLKNTLDAVGPLDPRSLLPAFLQPRR